MKWDEMDLDAMKEMANIGAGNSSTALARIIGKKVMIEVPEVHIVKVEKIPVFLEGYTTEKCTGVLFQFYGDVSGVMLHVLPQEARDDLVKKTVHGGTGEMMNSAIEEISNILIGNYVSAIGRMLNLEIIYAPPQSAEDSVYAIIDGIIGEMALREDEVFLFKTVFVIEGKNVKSVLLMFMHQDDAEKFKKAIKSI